jgi:hypothetical protein
VRGGLQLFMDMAILVETQGDLIDQIEFSVMNSKAFTEKAVVTLQETAKIVTNTRKVRCSHSSIFAQHIHMHMLAVCDACANSTTHDTRHTPTEKSVHRHHGDSDHPPDRGGDRRRVGCHPAPRQQRLRDDRHHRHQHHHQPHHHQHDEG